MTAASGQRMEWDRGATYATPTLNRLGSATELTKSRMMSGAMDGGANNTRTS